MEILSGVASTTPFNFIDAKVKSPESDLSLQLDSTQKVKVNLTMAKRQSRGKTVFVEGYFSNAPAPLSCCPGSCSNVELPQMEKVF